MIIPFEGFERGNGRNREMKSFLFFSLSGKVGAEEEALNGGGNKPG